MNSSDKGKSYERKIAKALSIWCGFELIRTPMSGGWQGTSGDIKPKDATKLFPFVLECKKQEQWNMEQILSNEGSFFAWIKQAEAEIIKDRQNGIDCVAYMLIFSRNHKPDYVALPYHIVADLTLPINRVSIAASNVVIFELHKFTAEVSYDTLLKCIKN